MLGKNVFEDPLLLRTAVTEESHSPQSWLRKEIDDAIDKFHHEADKHKRMHYTCRYTAFTLTVVATVLASVALVVQDEASSVLNVVIVCVTAAMGAIASFEGMRKPADKWHNERRAEYALKDIKRELDFTLLTGGGAAEVQALYTRMVAVIESAREAWSRYVEVEPPGPVVSNSGRVKAGSASGG